MCYGCGSANPDGLHIKSYWSDDGKFVVCQFDPQPKFSSGFKNATYGGLIASLIDCHSNWTATYHLMKQSGVDAPPCTVTAEYAIKLNRPTPTDGDVEIVARPIEMGEDRAVIEAELTAGGKVCATSRGTFVAVKPGHPAYHRW